MPDKERLNQLGSTETVGEFQFNPPKGYTLQTQTGTRGAKLWLGPDHRDPMELERK